MTNFVHPRSAQVVTFQETLKYNRREERQRQIKSSAKTRSKSHKKSISFDNNVNVVPIPKREEYSTRVSHRLWSSSHEIHENAARNSVEFAAEGWNWRTVTEDEHMYVCGITGQLIHPVHYENDYY